MTFAYVLVGVVLAVGLSVAIYGTVASIRAARRWLSVPRNINGATIIFRVLADTPELRRALDLALTCLAEVYPLDTMQLTLNDMAIAVMPTESWAQPETGIMVGGEALVSLRTVRVNKSLSSLAHEMAHLIEAGPARMQVNESHGDWAARGVFAAIDKYQALLEGKS